MFAMLDIMNAALISQGQYEITENDGSDEFRLLSRNWPTIVQAELEDGNYAFTRAEAALTTYITGKFGFAYGFAFPSGAIFIRQAWIPASDGKRDLIAWAQDGQYVYADQLGISVEYLIAQDEALWSANFARGVQMKLEAVVARAIREEANEAMALEQGALVYFARARAASSKSRSQTDGFIRGRIASARFSRRV